jgi:hypothetical protein
MKNTTIEKLRILVKYKRDTDHFADTAFTVDDIMNAMEDYHKLQITKLTKLLQKE